MLPPRRSLNVAEKRHLMKEVVTNPISHSLFYLFLDYNLNNNNHLVSPFVSLCFHIAFLFNNFYVFVGKLRKLKTEAKFKALQSTCNSQ